MRTITLLTAMLTLGLAANALGAGSDCSSCSNVPVNPTYVSPAAQSSTVYYRQPVTYYYAPAANCCPTTAYPYVAPRPVVMFRPIVSLGPMPSTYAICRGIYGQTTVYVPGQPIRNAVRYISP